jgi:hypothetical protein
MNSAAIAHFRLIRKGIMLQKCIIFIPECMEKHVSFLPVEYVPAKHCRQAIDDEAPTRVAKLPAWQSLHVVCASAVEYMPALQERHTIGVGA